MSQTENIIDILNNMHLNLHLTYGGDVGTYQRMGTDSLVTMVDRVFSQHRRYAEILEKLSVDVDSFKLENGI